MSTYEKHCDNHKASILKNNFTTPYIYTNKEQHTHASDEKKVGSNLKNPSSATKVQHGLRPEEYFETSPPGGSPNRALKQQNLN